MRKIITFLFILVISSAFVFSIGEDIPLDSINGNFQDSDGNGYPDEGFYVNGRYDYKIYSDLNENSITEYSNGTISGNLSELNQSTITICEYKINYRLDFGNDLGANSGWIQKQVICTGIEESHHNFLIVHKSDPRYTLNSSWNLDDWQYAIHVSAGEGNSINKN